MLVYDLLNAFSKQLDAQEAMNRKAEEELNPHDIDAFWLQRELNKFYNDAEVSQARSVDVLNALEVSHSHIFDSIFWIYVRLNILLVGLRMIPSNCFCMFVPL